ncbi:acyl-CoA N-acyltransferase [Bombardia bombarda]|uniref:Acyl-CoA N-acyltransferase n=1 Tax=Bombardia bombarda TaxID=252184 RepID=A0AA40CDP4_9PEZI|nr:acyl-CoA N-acyltransferase [Bombardia bombarda]
MSFSILPALIPDIGPVYDAYFAAFSADPASRHLLDIFFPDGFESEEFRKAHTDGTAAYWQTCQTQYTYKCVDRASGKIVGMALFDVFVLPRTSEQRAFPELSWLQGEQRERADKTLKPLWEAREKLWGGRPHIYVHAFAVDPKQQGRGAGAALVQSLIKLGNDCQLPIYLEATPRSAALYKKMGFQTFPHDQARVVTEDGVDIPLMVKQPLTHRL